MKVHIVGAGPTGLTIAWELSKLKQYQIKVYDKKSGPGGSWWEPPGEKRNIHAVRAVFKGAFVNTVDIFNQMGIKWSDVFEKGPSKSPLGLTFTSLDYCALGYLALRVLMSPHTYKRVSLKDALSSELSEKGRACIEHLTYQLDGVSWDVMTAYEFIRTIDYTQFKTIETQKIPGSQMGFMMQSALEKAGVEFLFNSELDKVVYDDDGVSFHAYFSDEPTEDGVLILCPDAVPAKKLIGDNWGPDAGAILTKGAYECVTIMLYYDTNLPDIPSGLTISMNTELGMIAHVLNDKKTIAVELLKPPPSNLDPDQLIEEVIKQLKKVPNFPNLPPLKDNTIGWGSGWVGEKWTHTQSSMALSSLGPLPFFGKNKRVAMCGMMSDRATPFACIEAAVEVGRKFSSQNFGTQKPRVPWTMSKIILIIIIICLALSYKAS
jgi:hypothetical protein